MFQNDIERANKMKIVVLNICFLFAFFLQGCASNSISVEEKKAKIFYAKGSAELLYKKYTSALKSLLESNKLKPNQTKTLNNLGMAYYFKGQVKAAKKYLHLSIKADPENADPKTNLASIYFKEGNLDLAEKEYNKIQKNLTYKRQFRVLYNLALIAFKTGRLEKGKKHLKKAMTERADYCPAPYLLGMIYKSQKNITKAKEFLKKAIKGTCYKNPRPHFELAKIFMDEGNSFSAKENLQTLIRISPETTYAKKAKIYLNRLNNKLPDDDLINNKLTKKAFEKIQHKSIRAKKSYQGSFSSPEL